MEQQSIKEKLSDILTEVNYGQLCIHYFQKNPAWLYSKINREQVNEETADFSEEELAIFKGALVDLSIRIRRVADSL